MRAAIPPLLVLLLLPAASRADAPEKASAAYASFLQAFKDATKLAGEQQKEQAVAGFRTAVALFKRAREESADGEAIGAGFAANVYNSYAAMLAETREFDQAVKMYNVAAKYAEAGLRKHRKRDGSLMSFGDGEALDRYDLEELEKAEETRRKEAAAKAAEAPKKKKKKQKKGQLELPEELGLGPEDVRERFELEEVQKAHFGLAMMSEMKNDLEGAVSAHERSRKYARDRGSLAKACKELGILHMRRNDMNAALDMLTDAVELVPDMPKAKSNLALVQHKLGMALEAKGMFEEAIELEPRNANGIANYGTLLAQMGDWKGAREAFHRALTVDPNHKHAQTQLDQIEDMESSGEEPINVFAQVPEPKFRSKMARVGRVAGIPGYRT